MDHQRHHISNLHHRTDSSNMTQTHHHHHHHHHDHHHHHHHQHTTTPTHTATTDGNDLFHHVTESLTSHDPHHHHDNDLDTNSVNDFDLQHNHHDSHLDPAAGGMKHHGMGHMHMEPIFKWVRDVPVLFEQWTTSTIIELTLAMVAAALLAAVYELLRNWLSTWDNHQRSLCTMPWWKCMALRIYRSVLHALNAAVGYVQMLFAMTYDLRIFVAIILGSGLGFFVLGPYFRQRTVKKSQARARRARRARKGSGGRNGSGCSGGVGERERFVESNGKEAGEWRTSEETELQQFLTDRETVV